MVVLDGCKYMDKLNNLLGSGAYKFLHKDPTDKVESKLHKLLSKHKTAFPTDLKLKLISYHGKPPYLYSLPKIHKLDIPLRPTVNSIGSPCYALASLLHQIPSPIFGKSGPFVKNSGHFIQLLTSVNLQSLDTLVSFHVVSIFTNVLVYQTPQIVINKLKNIDGTVCLQVEDIVELLEVCLRTIYFQVDDKFFHQKMTFLWEALYHSSLATTSWSVLRNWLLTRHNTHHHCGSGMFVVWPHGPK
jgi:hypothetical protein